jgi:cyclopropane-fatty-acyl-phospholipid synthase
MSTHPSAVLPARPALGAKLAARLQHILEEVPCDVVLPSGERLHFGKGAPRFTVTIRNERAIARSVDEFALAEAFVNGDFDIDGDMMTFFDVRTRLTHHMGFLPWVKLWSALLFLAPTTVNRKAIRHHYEFGEDFFLSFIDKDYHLYSHGFFATETESLETASERKLETAFNWTQCTPGMRVLDIGAGWGGVTRYFGPRGVDVTSLTLAQDSLQHITKLLKDTGYPGRVLFQDFLTHEPEKPYDAIVILGVIEHIPNYRKFFQQAWRLLKPGGRIYMDASADIEKYTVSRYTREYIYPGTHTFMCVQDVMQEMLYYGFLPIQMVQDDQDYSRTMKIWAERMQANKDMIVQRWGEQTYRAFWLYLWSGAYVMSRDLLQAYHLVAERRVDPGPRPNLLKRSVAFVREQF